MSICCWNDSHGTTCRWPGPFSADTHGGSRWYCVWHWRAFGLDRLDMKTEGDRVVRESLEWNGSPESYLALRAEAEKRAHKADAGTNGRPQQEGQGSSGQLRNDALGVARVDGVCRKISDLVPQVESRYEAEW